MRLLRSLICVAAIASPLAAQHGDDGVVLGTAGVGIIHHFNDRYAIRPEVSFSHTSSTSTSASGLTINSSSTVILVAVNLPRYFASRQGARLYLSPRVGYQASTGSTDTWSFSGSVGAQYEPTAHFAAFAESGLNFSRLSTTSFSGNTIGTRSAIGAIWYFGQ